MTGYLSEKHQSKVRVVRLFFCNGRQRAVAGANQGFRRQRENLFPHFLPRQIPRLVAPADGPGENRVATMATCGASSGQLPMM